MRQKKVYAFVRKLTRQGEIFKGIFGWTLEACKICTLFYVFTLADWNLDIQFDRSFLLKKKAVFQPWREQGMKWTLWLIRARNWFQLRWNQERPLITLYFRDSGTLSLSAPLLRKQVSLSTEAKQDINGRILSFVRGISVHRETENFWTFSSLSLYKKRGWSFLPFSEDVNPFLICPEL